MARFRYVAREAGGKRVTGIEEGPDSRTVAANLRARGVTPVSLNEVSARNIFAGRRERRGRGRPTLLDVATFIRQLSVMLGAGVGLVAALDDLADQNKLERPRFGAVLEDIRNRIIGGSPLSTAIKEHPKVFPSLVPALIRAGEESGNLEGIMGDLADYLDSQVALRRKVTSALTYPFFIAVVFLGVVAALFLYFLPKFNQMFMDVGGKLPKITRVALAISNGLRTWWPAVVVVLVGGFVTVRLLRRLPGGRDFLDRLKLKLPLVGQVIHRVVLVRFIETLATMQRSGVPILMSLDIASNTAGNAVIEEAVRQARKEVMRGSFLSHELGRYAVFPRMMVRMVAVGEETGKLEGLLSRAAAYYKDEVDNSVQRMTRLIEPVMIVFMGVIVGFVLFSIYLPIFVLTSKGGG